MAYALSGAHGSGKSTLAEAFSAHTGLEYRPFKTSTIMAKAGWTLDRVKTLEDRVAVQEVIINGAETFFKDNRTLYVTDRSPLDFAAYLLADARNEPITPELDARVEGLILRCIEMCNAHFAGIVILYHDIPYVEREDRPHVNRSYQEHHHTLLSGLAGHPNLATPVFYIRRGITPLEMRIAAMMEVHRAAMDMQMRMKEMCHVH